MTDLQPQASPTLPPDLQILLREIVTLMAELRDGAGQGAAQSVEQAVRLEKTVAEVTEAMDRFGQSLSTVTEHLSQTANLSERLDRIEAKLQARETEGRTLLQEVRSLIALLKAPI